MANAGRDRWYFDDGWYATTLESDVSTGDGIGLELDDVAPAPGSGSLVVGAGPRGWATAQQFGPGVR